MRFDIILPLVIGTARAWTTKSQNHFHRRVNDFKARPTYRTEYPIPTKGIIGNNSTSNATYGNTGEVTWLPSTEKVRGVNLGSQFIIEPWMAYDEFNKMGCGDQNDEWSCVQKLGQEQADAVFDMHWDMWVTQEDIANISAFGLNVIRIPVGFWIKEDLVQEGEYYPRGGLKYLDRLVGWAADAGLYVIMDLHGGPGVQYPNQQYTGHVKLHSLDWHLTNIYQGVDTPGFYTSENYERAIVFLEWMTQRIHSNYKYRTTGVLQVINEPVHAAQYPEQAADMLKNFYAPAYTRIRSMEQSMGVRPANKLKIQYMGEAWGAGDPTTYLPSNATGLLFDDHRYYKWDSSVTATKDGYIEAACSDNRGNNSIIIGEWSIAVADDVSSSPEFAINGTGATLEAQKEWYQKFWAAQVQAFERSGGWIFWTYKCNWINGIDEWRWCYQSAVANGVIPEDASSAVSFSPCS